MIRFISSGKGLILLMLLITLSGLFMYFHRAGDQHFQGGPGRSPGAAEDHYPQYLLPEGRIPAVNESEGEQAGDKVAYLTFDDGPSENTEAVLDILKEYDIKATFFVNGREGPFAVRMYRRMVEEGHAIGNHTYSHNYRQIYRSVDSFFADLEKLENYLFEVAEVRPKIIRFPGGSTNTVSRSVAGKDIMHDLMQLVQDKGYIYVDWNVCAFDGYRPAPGPSTIMLNVLGQSENRRVSVILLHDSEISPTTPEALPGMIEGLHQMGFRFKVITPEAGIIKFW